MTPPVNSLSYGHGLDEIEHEIWLESRGLRHPRYPKPHIMLRHGWWWFIDRPLTTWLQRDPILYPIGDQALEGAA